MKEMIAKAQMSLEKVKGEVVTQTLDKLNSPTWGDKSKKVRSSSQTGMQETYELSKNVLSAAYNAKGIGINLKG